MEKVYPGLLMPGGDIRWKQLQTDKEEVKLAYNEVEWDSIQDYYGIPGIICATYFYGEFSTQKHCRALVYAKGIGSFMLNGRRYLGDLYRQKNFMVPVVLHKGKNRIIIKDTGFKEHNFRFRLVPVAQPILILKNNITKPDFIRNGEKQYWLGIPILNTTSKRLYNIKIELNGEAISETEKTIKSIVPLSVIKLPIMIEKNNNILQGETTDINITLKWNDYTIKDKIQIAIKDMGDIQIKTFRSKIDNSCQYYALRVPARFNRDSSYGLIMTCHGAGVRAGNMVKSYTRKDWAFIAAPTNRGRFGFDWQDWGMLDFFEVLEDVKARFKIDPNRIYLTGHSMGGHGVWHIGLSFPDRFSVIAPSAGWTSFRLYIPWFLQKAELFGDPGLLKIRDMALVQDNPLILLENGYNLSIYILQGGVDNNVPPIQARFFNKYLSDFHRNFIYKEIEGKGHWWDIDSTPGIDCVDQKELMDFLKSSRRTPYPKRIVFKTADIDYSNAAYWIRIDQLEHLYRIARVDIQVKKKNFIEAELNNIHSFTVFLNDRIVSPGNVMFKINGRKIKYLYRAKCEIGFIKEEKGFVINKEKNKGLHKKKGLYGPIKKAYFTPFILIYGTIGDSSSTEENLAQARWQSYLWYYRGNGFVEIIPDTEVTDQIIKDYNLILFGNTETNFILKWINYQLPIHMGEEYIVFDNKKLKDKNLVFVEVYPNPLNPRHLVLVYSPISRPAEKFMGIFSPLYSGSGLPDYIIYDESVLKYGRAGVKALGFFDKDWKFNPHSGFISD